MKRGLVFFFFVGMLVCCCNSAKADIEAFQAVLTKVEGVSVAKEEVLQLQSMKESAEQLKTQVTSAVDKVKDAVSKVQSTYQTVQEKAQAIKDQASGAISAFQNKDISGLKDGLSNMELSGLSTIFNGTKDDDEMAEAVLDTMVRKKGEDSIANQKALSKALNKKNGSDVANLFADSLILRQEIRKEKDDPENPETVQDALNLKQKTHIESLRRRNHILKMNAGISRFNHALEIQNIDGEYESSEEAKNE